jgi:hydroxyacylglutathione hydrolase
MAIEIHTIVSDPFAENSYIVWRKGNREAFIVDPGFEPGLILDFLNERELTCTALVNTHGHVDHMAGNAALKQAFPAAEMMARITSSP